MCLWFCTGRRAPIRTFTVRRAFIITLVLMYLCTYFILKRAETIQEKDEQFRRKKRDASNTKFSSDSKNGAMYDDTARKGYEKMVVGHRAASSSTLCPEISLPSALEKAFEFEFQKVDDSKTMYLYSAYVDTIKNGIRLLAIAPVYNPDILFCQIWSQGSDGRDLLDVMEAEQIEIVGGHSMTHEYIAIFLHCPLDIHRKVPHLVSIVNERCKVPTNVLKIKDGRHEPIKFNFTVCVKPFNFSYNKTWQLVEFIELSRILGADRFVFYDFSTSPDVLRVLKHYSKQGLVEVLPWKLPVKTRTWPPTPGSQIHAFGQLGSSNDCLYRYRHLSQYQIFVDLDEFIIPRNEAHLTWMDVVQENLKIDPNASGFIFQNLFFRKDWSDSQSDLNFLRNVFSDETINLIEEFRLDSLQHITHEKRALGVTKRSKYIINPRKVTMVDIHIPAGNMSQIVAVSSSQCALFHYRDWERPEKRGLRQKSTLVPQKYGRFLLDRIKKVRQDLEADGLQFR